MSRPWQRFEREDDEGLSCPHGGPLALGSTASKLGATAVRGQPPGWAGLALKGEVWTRRTLDVRIIARPRPLLGISPPLVRFAAYVES